MEVLQSYGSRSDFPTSLWSIRSGPRTHIKLQFIAEDNGKIVSRSYTPIEYINKGSITIGGDVQVLIFPAQGDETIRVALANSLMNQVLQCPTDPDFCFNTLGLISAGTGVTLMLSTLSYILWISHYTEFWIR